MPASDPFVAARTLSEQLRLSSPFISSVGLGGTDAEPLILVYANRNLTKRERGAIPHKFMGVSVIVKAIGRAQPLTSRQT
jgi:hypothetical protein